jgi:predicted hydrocarbon binding protein
MKETITMSTKHRDVLGDFSSVVCFKAIIVGVEDTLGTDGAAVVFTRAGKVRGQNLATALGLAGKNLPLDELTHALNAALGQDGTRLCVVKNAYERGEETIIETSETVCSAGEPDGSSRECTFTLGAVWGALEAITGKTYLGRHTESVLRGGQSDTFVFSPL